MTTSSSQNWPRFDDAEILAARPARNDARSTGASTSASTENADNIPNAFFVEPEYQSPEKGVEDVATIFLKNKECPFRCLMCDLWKNTTEHRVSPGAISQQISHALEALPPAQHVKLYNSANFFDPQAIPDSDYDSMLRLVQPFNSVIVENHPKLVGSRCFTFAEKLDAQATQLEVAMGLECVHPDVLERLNKQMTVDDFRSATAELISHGIRVRAFILLRPPFLSEDEGVTWAIKSIEFAFDCGVDCCSVIPTRFGNGMLQRLHSGGWFNPPTIQSMENVQQVGLSMQRGRIFMDTWDALQFTNCEACSDFRVTRIEQMNRSQSVADKIECPACDRNE